MEDFLNKFLKKFLAKFNLWTDIEQLGTYTGDFVKIVLIFIAMVLAVRLANMAINKFFDNREKFKIGGEEKRINTIKGIINSIVRYTIYFVAFTPILQTVGIDISSLIAAAGVGGLAIGFGAQNLVRDVISGFFILLEDQFQVGDHVEIGTKSGIIEDMALRVTTIRDLNGDLHIIPNGSIDIVTNKCRGNMRAWVDVGIAYEENIDNAIQVLKKLCEEMAKENEKIIEGPTVLGVTNLGESDVVLSVIAKTVPLEQWEVERELRKKIKERFDEKGIEIPYPRRVVIRD